MHSIYTTSLRTQPSQHHEPLQSSQFQSSIDLSQSYKDMLFSHIIDVQKLHDDKENYFQPCKKTTRKNNYGKIAQDMILGSINPNLGSLGQFIMQKPQNRVIYTNRKYFSIYKRKRNEQINEQNGLKKIIADKSIEQSLLLSKDASGYEKKLASRVIVQKLFKNIYHTPVEQFLTSNASIKSKKSQLLNISTLQSLLSDGNVKQNVQSVKRFKSEQSDSMSLSPDDRKKTNSEPIKLDSQIKLQIINKLKSKYHDLRKIQIPKQCHDFNRLIEAQNQLDKYLKQLSQTTNFAKRSSVILNSARNSLLNSKSIMRTEPVDVQRRMEEVCEKFKKAHLKSVICSETIAKVTQEEVVLMKMQFKDLQMGLYMISQVRFQKLKVIRFQHIKIQPNLLFLFLDVLCKLSSHINPLKEMSICAVSIQNLTKFSEKITEFLRLINVRKFCLNYTDIGSRQFSRICVGIAENQYLEEVELRNNRIDFLAIKPLQNLMKINSNLKSIDLKNNEIANYPQLKAKDERIMV